MLFRKNFKFNVRSIRISSTASQHIRLDPQPEPPTNNQHTITTSAADEYFTRLESYGVIVCTECKYGVWPGDVGSHLRGKHHRVKKNESLAIHNAVDLWPGLKREPGEFVVPPFISEPIPALSKPEDGWLCQASVTCKYVCRSEEQLMKHWRASIEEGGHGWNIKGGKGRGGRLPERQKIEIKERINGARRRVQTQRFYPSRFGSQYFYIRPTQPRQATQTTTNNDSSDTNDEIDTEVNEDEENQDNDGEADVWSQIQTESKRRYEARIEAVEAQIGDSEKNEVNPWLERTDWAKYLRGHERDDLLALVEKPDSVSEPLLYIIWCNVEELAKLCQTQVSGLGVTIRMEAVRDMRHQTRYKPLVTYWEPESIKKRSAAWAKIIMFFCRSRAVGEEGPEPPPYKFNIQQKTAFSALADAVEEFELVKDLKDVRDERIMAACLDFCLSLLAQRMQQNEYGMAMVCALAVLGVDIEGWKSPSTYPPILSAIIKGARFMVATKAAILAGDGELVRDEEEEELLVENSYDLGLAQSTIITSRHNTPNNNKKTCIKLVTSMMDAFMVRGTQGPMQWMLDLRTYGLKMHYNTTTQGHVEWINEDELLYKNMQFNMREFRSMIHGVLNWAQRIMQDELLLCSEDELEMPTVSWHQIRDNPSDTRIGWNFLRDQRTTLPIENGGDWLFNRVRNNPAIKAKFERGRSESQISRSAVQDYMDQVDKFREWLLVLMHITGGQPARGTELLSILHSNTAKAHRSIFVEDGLVVFVTSYHKGYALSGETKVIHRYLPKEVGTLLVLYLWLVLPFQTRLQTMVFDEDPVSAHLWPASCNGIKWNSDKMRRVLKRATQARLGQPLNIAAYRDVAIAISRRFMRGKAAFKSDQDDDGEEEEIEDEQAGHTTHVAGAIYARFMTEMAGAIAGKREQFRKSSVDWHRFLGFASAIETVPFRMRNPYEEEAEAGRFERRARLKRCDPISKLRKFMNDDNAQFRGNQRVVIDAIFAGSSPIVAVMPTGTGKSILFMLPAWIEPGGTTILVVPLIALRQDLVQRCKASGIRCAEWTSQRPTDAETIVLVTPESAVSDEFSSFISRLTYTRQLERVVIDEGHVILNKRNDFRPKLQRLGVLGLASTQVLILSATIPPQDELELTRRMGWLEDEVIWYRMSTTRSNIAYSVIEVDQKMTESEHDKLIAQIVQSEDGKTVVYCNSRSRVISLVKSELIDGCEGFHGGMSKDERKKKLELFREGDIKCLISTSAFGMGIDIPNIRLIVHADEPRTLLDYGQESGRAGRDGQVSQAIVVRAAGGGVGMATKDEDVEGLLASSLRC
jgi:superfamily II DNA or RNA helicase